MQFSDSVYFAGHFGELTISGKLSTEKKSREINTKKPMDYYAFWKKKKQKLNYELFFNFLPFFFHIIINAQKKAGIELCSPLWNIKVFFLEKKNCRPWRKTYTQDNHTSLFFSHLQKKMHVSLWKSLSKNIFSRLIPNFNLHFTTTLTILSLSKNSIFNPLTKKKQKWTN